MREGIEALGRIRAQGIALLFITFLVGVLAGFAGERVRAARAASETRPSPLARRPRPEALPPMFGRLDLTPEQRERIFGIMEAGRPRTDRVLAEMLPRLRAVTDSIHGEIRSVLTPEQAARWDSLLARMHGPGHRMMRPRMRGGGPRGMGPLPEPPR